MYWLGVYFSWRTKAFNKAQERQLKFAPNQNNINIFQNLRQKLKFQFIEQKLWICITVSPQHYNFCWVSKHTCFNLGDESYASTVAFFTKMLFITLDRFETHGTTKTILRKNKQETFPNSGATQILRQWKASIGIVA